MKRFLVLFLCAALCSQPVLAADTGGLTLQEEARQEETQEDSEGEGTQEDAQAEASQGENSQAGVSQEVETQEEDSQTETQEDSQAGNPQETENTSEEGGGNAGGIDVSAPSAVLVEASTGQIIYEKDADSVRPPASVTKIMTLLLIFDAMAEGKIKPEDEVTTSEYAASMGGSQVFLEPGETQTVDTMIKCISVASANDACVSFHNTITYERL